MRHAIAVLLLVAILMPAPLASSDWSDVPAAIHAVTSLITETQDPPIAAAVVARTDFHAGIVSAAVRARQDGTITARESLRIRIAMLSPAFRQAAEDLAVIQIAFSGSDDVPVDANGQINRTAIDWSNLPAFLEALIPLLIQLLQLFGIS